MEAYNLQAGFISDTIGKKTITKNDLLNYHQTGRNLLLTSPIFGKKTVKCDSDFYPASSYKTDDSYYMTQVQYKCCSNYSNAVFLYPLCTLLCS